MSDDPRKKIVENLLERSDDGSVSWQRTLEANVFEVMIRDNKISIKFETDDFDSICRINIFNKHGDIVESFSDEDLDLGERGPDNKLVWYPKMKRIYNAAKRKALGTDEVISDILDGLNTLF